ncbi:flagellar biosynthesis protein FlhA [Cellvibrio zantedeschiae]|uniref:Flagellar biosynthesis protein FlhA n=1 Tax=Cellvibrio zantedeschiae TaxID=1237077 RepID=A0ABQ3B988_9GAMM|nr:flagellar biosynthesis protein FlhA [Cellvibrio zantedeschiae]GGY84989.1 flagellar biosynthesis protein FlhA [Cellvibrio zantedeschiae]
MQARFASIFLGAKDLILIIGMIGILMILFVPISKGVLSFLLLTNFSVALLILLVTFYTEKPLEFSTFPSLLLMTTLFRLSLNISTTRLILQNGDAGEVIDAVGAHVVAGNYVIGLVIFFILIVVQYIVVTNGAQRVAEVAARFTLDSLPGKQMSIDADLNMGIIDTDEAKRRRSQLEKESNFYGAMDGASKFVKGDAVAGIVIIIINIIGGLSIGIAQRGMSWGDALHRYTLLTVGDGIVTQIPSLIIAVASGIIITRAATDARLGVEVFKQFSAHPKTIAILLVALVVEAFIPGLPKLPIIILIAIFGGIAWLIYQGKKKQQTAQSTKEEPKRLIENEQFYEDMITEPFEIKIGSVLHDFFAKEEYDIERRISILRKNIANELGLVLPTLTFKKDVKQRPNEYKIYIAGESFASGLLKFDCLLAINPRGDCTEIEGESTREPTYGLPAKWINPELRTAAQNLGYTLIEPETVLLTHLQEISKRYAGHFLTRAEVEKIIDLRRSELGNVVDDVIPAMFTYSDIQKILQGLLAEQVPIKNITAIFEVIADLGRTVKDPEELVESCRQKLKASICESVCDSEGKIHAITFYPNIERKLLASAGYTDINASPLSPKEIDTLINKISKETEKLLKANVSPVILCAAPVRKFVKKVMRRALPLLKVISINEIDERVSVVSSGIIEFEQMAESI